MGPKTQKEKEEIQMRFQDQLAIKLELDILNEEAISSNAKAFLKLVKGVIGLDAEQLVKLAMGRKQKLAKEAANFSYTTINEKLTPKGVKTLATGSQFRAVTVDGDKEAYNFIVPLKDNDREYTDAEVAKSLSNLLLKRDQAVADENTSAIKSYDNTLFKTPQEAIDALQSKDGGNVEGDVGSPSRLKEVIRPIVAALAGAEASAASKILDSISDRELLKAFNVHIWAADSITEFARIAWSATSNQLNSIQDHGRGVIRTMAQIALAYMTFKYIALKATELEQAANQEDGAKQAEQDELNRQRDIDKYHDERQKSDQEKEQHVQDKKHADEEHAVKLEKDQADISKKHADVEKAHAQAEAAAKRPI